MHTDPIISNLKHNISKVIIGKDDKITLLLTALLAKGHLLLEDTPGTGKTMLAKALAASIDGTCKRVQFTPDLLPSDIFQRTFSGRDQPCNTTNPVLPA